jgi:hypothetical protein
MRSPARPEDNSWSIIAHELGTSPKSCKDMWNVLAVSLLFRLSSKPVNQLVLRLNPTSLACSQEHRPRVKEAWTTWPQLSA